LKLPFDPNTLLARDAANFQRLARRASEKGAKPLDAQRWAADLAKAQVRAEARRALIPAVISFPPELPVTQARESLKAAIAAHQIVVICGETGSGKTTQLPKLCLELGRGARGLIGHTQPRRLAARSVAARIARELNTPLGELVGYETRFDRRVSEKTLVKLMTDGILLAELQTDKLLSGYDTIIIDEAHERSLNIDFLLGWLKRIAAQRADLKIIITSATLDPEKFARHFGASREAGGGRREAAGVAVGSAVGSPSMARHAATSPARPGLPWPGANGGDLPFKADPLAPVCPILNVSGRTFPVDVLYAPPKESEDIEDQVANAVDVLWGTRPDGDVLVFLPGEREINDCLRVLTGRFPRAQVLPLYSRLPAAQQDRVFATSSGGPVRIILATNVAETSVTVPGIRYVVDTGTARMSRHNPRTGVQQLQIEPIAQSAANQRAGRCGRLGPGICVRLYAEDDYAARPTFTDPEILRSNLAGVILQMTSLGLGDVEDFPWLDAPESRHINEGYRVLSLLGALVEDDYGQRRLTPLGRQIARLPLDVRIARIALAGAGSQYAPEVFALAAALSVQDPHETPLEQQTQARQKHAEWRNSKSDFLTLLSLWQRWQKAAAAGSRSSLRKWCRTNFVNYLRMEEWEAVYKQIDDLLGKKPEPQAAAAKPAHGSSGQAKPAAASNAAAAPAKADSLRALRQLAAQAPVAKPQTATPTPHHKLPTADEDPYATLYTPVHKALLAGLIDHIGNKLPEKPEYQGPKGRRFKIFPGSALAKKSPPWLMHAAIVHTSQVFARSCAAVEPEWLAEIGAHLVKRVLHHPSWNAERGEVIATEHLSILGLPLLKQSRHYGRDEPVEARAIFIRDGLIAGNLIGKPEFLKKNLALVEAILEKEARQRRPDLLADEAQLFRFYDARIPADVCTVAGLKHWLKSGMATGAGKLPSLVMQEADALRPGADANVEQRFPDAISLAGIDIPLSYEHDPGTDADGVSFHLPLAQLFALPEDAFDWLVPGLLAAKIEALIKTLPTNLRRLCQPSGDYSEAIAESVTPEGDLLHVICTRFKAMTGVILRPEDFAPEKLSAHFLPRLVVEDAQGTAIAEGSSLAELRQRLGVQARSAFNSVAAQRADTRSFIREQVTDWDFASLPNAVALQGGAKAIPALTVEGNKVALRLFESADAAEQHHALGLRALLLAKLADRVRDLSKTAKQKLALCLAGTPHTPESIAQALAERCIDTVLLAHDLPRDEAAFQAAYEKRGQFSQRAYQLLDDLSLWLPQAARLRQNIAAIAKPYPQAAADASQQLTTLLGAGFITAVPDAQWPRIGVYLKALEVRLSRLPLKPQKDADALAQVAPYLAGLPAPFHSARWLLEEWRVLLFAQELKAQGAPSAVKLAAALIATA